jgi:hypothetical protein
MTLSNKRIYAIKRPATAKELSKTVIIKLIVILVVASYSLLHATASHSANTSDSSSHVYMDLSASIKELQRRAEKVSPGIVFIIAYDVTGAESGNGTGFFMDPDGRIITNAAVLKNAYSAEVISETNYYDNVTIINYDEDFDLALIQVNAIDESPLSVDFEHEVEQNDMADIIGKSRDSEIFFSESSISSINAITEDLELIEVKTRLPISQFKASKDGPLLNLSGKVIGMTTTSIYPPNTIGIDITAFDDKKINAVSLHSIKHFLSKPGIATSLHPSKSKVWHKFIIQKLKTMLINSFVFLYTWGFPKTLGILFAFILLISLIQWFYKKLIKTIK